MLTWQQVRDLLDEAKRRSPRRTREALANQLEELCLGAKPRRGKEAQRLFDAGAKSQRKLEAARR